ncbi:maltase A1-like, partial [Contarinia nasturtii]|uniref:maltase A1-like n=1 Tax=Contarinia nasturtii TaxID=265458 RepID=UPI0012D4768C
DAETWFKGGNFYQVYPRSFKDDNNDGIGDLKGITSKLEHLKDIGIDGVWLSPIYKSPMVDFGYDISDFTQIQPEYGTLEDFEVLAQKCKRLGLRLILDFVPNHSSDQHEWFIKSVNKEEGYENFYFWHPGKVNETTGERSPPSNWLSSFRYSAWEWNEKRQEYYLHQFAIQQPDLNYRNPEVLKKMNEVLIYWLEKGVSGFRIDTIPSLYEVAPDENGNLPDEPPSGNCDDPVDPCYLKHIYTYDQDETYDVVYEWRELLNKFHADNGGDQPILMTEAYSDLNHIVRYYGNGQRNGSQIPFNFHLLPNVNRNSKAADYKKLIEEFLQAVPSDCEANWVLGNHDQKRVASRLGEKRVDLYNILLKTLPGISVTYAGEEIGMTDVIISWKDTVDPPALNSNETTYYAVSRDPARTPIQWDESNNAGFNRGNKTWLPISTNYKCVNVRTESTQPKSHLNVYKRLTKLRKEAGLGAASYESELFGEIYTYKRQNDSLKPIIVALNFGNSWTTIDVSARYGVSESLKVVTASIESQYEEGQIINGTRLTLPNDVGIVLTTV